MAQTKLVLTKDTVRNIMKKRLTIPEALVGKKVLLTIQGNGNVIDVTDKSGNVVISKLAGQEGIVLQKKIFNVRANSAGAMANQRTRQFMIDGLKAEQAGDTEKASELYNQYLNSCQISFGVLMPNRLAEELSSGVDIAGRIELVETENGKLLTIATDSITVKEPEMAESTSFDLDDFAAELEAEAKAAQAAAAPKADKKAKAK